jgi:NAD(P)-dependent dehydrogenase (short-subunit alcohol dehydrogenase family)
MAMRYEKKVVLVTAASSGIGAATARAFAQEGGKVVLSDFNDAPGKSLADALVAEGLTAVYHHCDATDHVQCEAIVDFVVGKFGRLDVAINVVGNIGGGAKTTDLLHEETLESYTETVDLNLKSTFFGMKYQIIQMMKQGGGAIANTTSMAGLRVSNEALASYSAAKAGVVHLSEWAAVRYADKNIRVNVVAPGLTATPAVRAVFDNEKLMEMALRTQPMARLMDPEDMAEAFLWLCSDGAGGVTGLTVPVAGGWAAR